jgi:hypothetical protein
MSRKRFWKTPPDLMKALDAEFKFTNDMCPFPKPDTSDALNMQWGESNFINPPFRREDGNGFGPTAFVRKAIEQHKQGKKSVLIIPTQSYVNLLLEAGAECRSLGRVKWRECDTDEICTSPSPITMFILK